VTVKSELAGAITAWHKALTPERAEESSAWLNGQLSRRELFFGTRPLCTVLRPRFLTPVQYRLLQRRIAVLLRAFDKALQAALTRPALLDQFGLLAWERWRSPGFPPRRFPGWTPSSIPTASGSGSPSTTRKRRPARRTTTR
jgi:hypothetical protein